MALEATYNCQVVASSGVKVRPDPSTANATNITMSMSTRFQISEIVPDRLDPDNAGKVWGHIFGGIHDGKYCALEYPGNPSPICTRELIEDPEPPNPPVNQIADSFTVIYRFPDGSTETKDYKLME